MKRLVVSLMLSTSITLSTIFASSSVYAEEKRATIDDAKKNLTKAIAFFKAQGPEKSLAEFSNKAGQFIDRDLYIFVINSAGSILAHGVNPKLVGGSLIAMKDADGKLFIQNMIDAVKTINHAEITYKWSNPVTKKVEEKKTIIEKMIVDTKEYILGCGAYTGK